MTRVVVCMLSPAQGDLLGWLLSTAITHDAAQARGALRRARARDELVNATMELRERARALHLHFPLKFTLSTAGPVVDASAHWAAIISRVETVRMGTHTLSVHSVQPPPAGQATLCCFNKGSCACSKCGMLQAGWHLLL